MPNIGSIISSHNKKVLSPPQDIPPCVCTRYACLVNGECERKSIIYQCTVNEIGSQTSETYVGLSENSFKDRITKHRKSFRDRHYHRNSLSRYIWKLKDEKKQFEIAWTILDQAKPYSPTTKICNLCLREKYFIIFEKNKATLNKRNEFFGFCLHKRKYLIENH